MGQVSGVGEPSHATLLFRGAGIERMQVAVANTKSGMGSGLTAVRQTIAAIEDLYAL
jgi:hypothetical protein